VAIAKRFDGLVRGRFIAKKLSTPIDSEKPTTVPIAIQSVCICEIRGLEIELPDTQPHACELGFGKTLDNQTQYPPSSRDVDECDWIDTLVTRCISANDRGNRSCRE
jgi:hypothetical protein